MGEGREQILTGEKAAGKVVVGAVRRRRAGRVKPPSRRSRRAAAAPSRRSRRVQASIRREIGDIENWMKIMDFDCKSINAAIRNIHQS
ncbi:Biogenesis of lysosome-related organelles complex 1 subunit 1 [Zea mays]|uniref:Biogenesis of lysosome-related organelles complex 1 subunit 1 n=1 Tax=Zea mays TaxID=4577 RepID=A0A1D6LS42_MAIZE|nr:Biogenesis of lysosome-related organelles complex 1 subunit 1 [Zea mays]